MEARHHIMEACKMANSLGSILVPFAMATIAGAFGSGCADPISEPAPSSFEEINPSVISFDVADLEGRSLRINEEGRYFVSPTTEADPAPGVAEKQFACAPYFEYCNPRVWHAGEFCYLGVCSPVTIGIWEPVVATSTCATPVTYWAMGGPGHAGHVTTPSNIDGTANYKTWEQCGINLCNAPQGESCNW